MQRTRRAFAMRVPIAFIAVLITQTAIAQTAARQTAAITVITGSLRQGSTAPLPSPVTPEQAVHYGLQHNPQVAAGVAGVASAAANYRSLAAPNTLDLGATRIQGTSTAPSLTGENTDTILDVGTTIDLSGQRRFQAAGARAQLGVTAFTFEETKLTLAQQIRDAYWSLAAARAQTKIAQEILDQVARTNTLTKTQQQAGAAPQVDVIRSGIDVANQQQAVLAAQGAETAALTAFNTALGRDPLAKVELADTVVETEASRLDLRELPTLEALTVKAIAQRGLVKSAREAVRVAAYSVKQNRAAHLPDLSVDYERSVQQPEPADSVVLTARFPIVDFGSVRHAVRSAEEARKQAEAQLKQTEQQVAQQVAQAVTDYSVARKQVTSYYTDILAPSIKLLAMAELGYKQGATGILPIIDAETTLRNARNGYVAALLALYKARDEVDAAVGGP